jgi:hypothetical protein
LKIIEKVKEKLIWKQVTKLLIYKK